MNNNSQHKKYILVNQSKMQRKVLGNAPSNGIFHRKHSDPRNKGKSQDFLRQNIPLSRKLPIKQFSTSRVGRNSSFNKYPKKHNNELSSRDSLQSISSHKEKKYDTIPYRLKFMSILGGNNIKPIIDINNLDTEYYIDPVKYNMGNSDGKRNFNRFEFDNGYRSCDSSGVDKNKSAESTDITKIINKKKMNFYKIINNIGGKIKYVKSGSSGHTFMGLIPIEDGKCLNYAIKVVACPKRKSIYGPLDHVERPENAEIMIIRCLAYFVINKHTPHIVLPIYTFKSSIKPFLSLIDDNVVDTKNKKYRKFLKKYRNGEFYNDVSILISEWANMGDLLEFIRNNYREFSLIIWKTIFFQIISTLAVIHNKFPSFRHNDLKANNILMHKRDTCKTRFIYTVNRHRYVIQNIGYQIKLWDFDFACIPGKIDNAKVSAEWTNRINVNPERNQYYDVHFFFNTFIKDAFFPQFMDPKIKCIPQEARDFVNRIVPPILQKGKYVTNRGRLLLRNYEFTTPNQILMRDPFFEELKYSNYMKQRKKKHVK
uniref:Protein kinase n=1 Tax=Mimivirus LCMiAC02 TaxID=2506609 RepID=A0A481Z1H8_9VIRU|nr:MAG: protein kinase [Mimivirus LCMiAC02]